MNFQIKNIQSLLNKEDKVDLGEEVMFGDRMIALRVGIACALRISTIAAIREAWNCTFDQADFALIPSLFKHSLLSM
ncbi:hypothetical protein [Scytonema sp. PCC 10023]|uniref:hypothetical protein n=1 Tax=Scytonema sp. PCC 10023 TaxID=1680591 RepID=UPI0039C6B1E5